MARTQVEMQAMALRHLGILATGEEPSADDYKVTADALSEATDVLTVEHGLTMPADLDATPDGLASALARFVAVLIGPHYEIATERRSRAVMRVRSYLLTDDREDRRDLDDSGTVDEDEAAAGLRALFY